jgi:predicted subunit of tRNA(5-methylaminomethyl-2-thiouridylate) methyltransferase
MDAAVLYSGGKDSTLAALLLAPFYDVTAVTATAGVTDAADHACRAARAAGLDFERVTLDRDVVETAADRALEDGNPRAAVQQLHDHTLETVAALEYDAVADGTRRDDRVPTVSRAAARSLEDRHGVDYVAPLSGFGHGAVDQLAEATLEIETAPSEQLPKGDYEDELRTVIAADHGERAVEAVFPDHEQSRVVGRR